MTVTVAVALEAATKIKDIVEAFGKVKAKLTATPKAAARDLVVALDHVYATFLAVASEIAAFQALGASVDGLRDRAPSLPQLQGGILRTRVRNAKGHSTVIGNIYRTHLDAWFRGELSQVDYFMAKSGFEMLGNADRTLFDDMLAVADTISTEASAVEDLTLEDRWEEARARVLASRQDLRALERVLGDTMDLLSDLKVEFIALSGTSNLQGP
jgi:hypothetical protein